MFWLGLVFLIVLKWYLGLMFEFTPTVSWIVFGIILIGAYFIYSLFSKDIINNREYFHNPFSASSFANYVHLTSGIKWSKSSNIKNLKNGIIVNKYKFDWSVKKYFSSLFGFFINRLEKDIIINPSALKKGSLVIGQMGSGKTVFLNNLLHQKFYKRAIIHDIKGDYCQKLYKQGKDVILNPFDKRGQLWDIFLEAKIYPQIIKPFFNNLIIGVMGKEKNFFTASASSRYINIFYNVLAKKLDSKESWQLFIDDINKFFKEVQEDTQQKSEKDVVSTMKLIIEFFEYQNYLIQNNTKTFTINKFLKRKDSKLFLLNKQSYGTFLNPYFAGFISAFTNIFMDTTKDDTDELTLFLIDEYLTFLPILDESTLTTIHTLIRSKGGCLFPAVQYVPDYNKELLQKLMNSVDHLFIFQTADISTSKMINELIGKVEYETVNTSFSNGDKNTSIATQRNELLSDDILKGLGKDFSHISFMPSRKLLYKGYTRLLKLENKNDAFIEADFKDYLLDYYKEK